MNALATAGRWLWHLPANVLIGCVRVYQATLSRLISPGVCRFHPTCSHYFVGAVEKYGAVRGTLRGLWRVLRCNPLCRGGFDPP